ncbi:MAG TPA: azurin [Xanthomonadaceae bacterium]|jgi:azurin
MRALVLASLLASPFAHAAAHCDIALKAGDSMMYDQRSVSVDAACKTITIHLTHTGTMAVGDMGHNVVIARTQDVDAIADDGMTAGVASDFLKPGDPRVIAHTKTIGGGEKADASFPADKLKPGDGYSFFCTVPGHAVLMVGQLLVK